MLKVYNIWDKIGRRGGTRVCFEVKNIRYTRVWKSGFLTDMYVVIRNLYWFVCNLIEAKIHYLLMISQPLQKINPEFAIGFDRLVMNFFYCIGGIFWFVGPWFRGLLVLSATMYVVCRQSLMNPRVGYPLLLLVRLIPGVECVWRLCHSRQ